MESHEICGCPIHPEKQLRLTDFDITKACTTLKKNCTKHYRWMQIRRALIDMERLTQLLRLEELAEECRCIQMAQNSRGSLLALLLHQTVTHEAPESNGETAQEEDDETEKEQENGREETDTDTEAKEETTDTIDLTMDTKKVDVVPKYPDEGASRKLEDGWQGVYGD